VIASSFDLNYNLTWILGYLTRELGVDAADVLILNPVSSRLDYGGAAGFRTKDAEKAIMRTGRHHAMRAVMDRQLVYFRTLKTNRMTCSPLKFWRMKILHVIMACP